MADQPQNPYGYETGDADVVRRANLPATVNVTDPSQVFFLGERENFPLSDEMGTTILKDVSVLFDASVPLVVAASTGSALVRLDELRDQDRPISAIVAWRLKEELLPRVFAMDAPVLMGIPTRDELLAAINDGEDNFDRDEERSHAARLAVREAMFEKSAMVRA